VITEQSKWIEFDSEFIYDSSLGNPTRIKTIMERYLDNYNIFIYAIAGDLGLNSRKLENYLGKNKIYN
jgi:hypothetical protein